MDDYTVSSLSESKNEWVVRLVNILTPLINEGFLSIFKESEKLCQDNDEYDKYLMTFQNFLSRVPKWNNDIVKKETQRIVEKSQCQYLDELITCVHIIHLKLLTSIRAGNNQKKIDIDIPQLEPFIHKIYITCARKLYSVVFLYEQNLIPLELQKNRKEVEGIIKESILESIRESIPVEKILRAYMDESTDIITTLKQENEDQKLSIEAESETEKEKEEITTNDNEVKLESLNKENEVIKVDTETKTDETKPNDTKPIMNVVEDAVPALAAAPAAASAPAFADAPAFAAAPAAPAAAPAASLAHAIAAPPAPVNDFSVNKIVEEKPNAISFNNTDSAIDVYKKEEQIDAPKTVERLEAISNERHEQAKLDDAMDDDDDDETIKIFDDSNINMDVQDLTPITLSDTPDLGDIQILT